MRCQLDELGYFCEECVISLPFWEFELQRTPLQKEVACPVVPESSLSSPQTWQQCHMPNLN